MKSANQMKELSFKNSKVGEYIETKVAPIIETTAQKGERIVRVITDNIPTDDSRATKIEKVRDYVRVFGYTVDCTSDKKTIYIEW